MVLFIAYDGVIHRHDGVIRRHMRGGSPPPKKTPQAVSMY
jgi:hypothetical protein